MSTLQSILEMLWNEEYNIVESLLIDRTFSINQKDERGRTILHLLLMKMMKERKVRLDAVRFLITSGADVNIGEESANEETSFHLALKILDPDLLQVIIDSSSFDVNKYNSRQHCTKPLSLGLYCDVPDNFNDDGSDVIWRSPQEKFLICVNGDLSWLLKGTLAGPCTHSVRDFFAINSFFTSPILKEITCRLEPKALSNLYLVGGQPITDEDRFNSALSPLRLQTLVLTNLHLTKIPENIYEMRTTLRVLKLGRNKISNINERIGQLTNLRILCLDQQKPKIKNVPKSFLKLTELQVLSLSNNGLEDVDWIVEFKNLQELRLDVNQISLLPASLSPLTSLLSLNISYNRFQSIPPSYADVIKRLRNFEYFSVTLRPHNVRDSITSLINHLQLQNFLSNVSQFPNSGSKDIAVGVVGGSNSGKKSLVAALKDEKGISRFEGDCKGDDDDLANTFTSDSFDFPDDSGHFHRVTMVTINMDFIDWHVRDLWLDVILLAIDLTSFESQNGGGQQFSAMRQILSTQQWLEAIFEIFPNVPVILVGTKAELIKSSTFSVTLQMLEDLINKGRYRHYQLHSNQLCSTCFLCSSKAILSRCLNVKSSSKFSCIDFSLTSTYGVVTSPCFATGSSDSSPFNGVLSPSATREGLDCEHSGVNFPHVIGYYEIDSRKCFPKDNKKHNSSVELLRKAILRHFASDNCLYSLDSKMNVLPDTWNSIIKHFPSISFSSFPFVPYNQIVAICRSFDIVYWQIPLLLRYCHIRGRIVIVPDCRKILIKSVITDPNWLVQLGYKVISRIEHVIVEVNSIKNILCNIMGPTNDKSIKMSRDILKSLCSIKLLLEVSENTYYVPSLSKRGDPNTSIWPSVPDSEEKQITCEFELRRQRSFLFKELIFYILSFRGKEILNVQEKPTPLVLNHHIVFFVACHIESCVDCQRIKRSSKLSFIAQPNNFLGQRNFQDNVFHKVKISSNIWQTSFRIFVRGTSPCCVMKSILNFIYLHSDDSEDGINPKISRRNTFMTSRQIVKSKTSFRNLKKFYNLCSCCMLPRCHKDFSVDDFDESENRHYVLCPKCVLSKKCNPQPIFAKGMSLKRKPLCDYWHHFGSWERAAVGNYNSNPADLLYFRSFMNLPDNETPRLVLLLLPTANVCKRDWMNQCKARFMEGFEIHFLCENLTHWHIVENSGFRMIRARKGLKNSDAPLASILSLALIFIQIIQGCNEFPCNSKVLLQIAQTFSEMVEYQRLFESEDFIPINCHSKAYDHHCWLLRNKERIISNLSKILSTIGDGITDLYFKNTVSVCVDKLFQVPTTFSRTQLAKFLQIDLTSGAFGDLKPIYIGRELRWVCQEHYEQLLSI